MIKLAKILAINKESIILRLEQKSQCSDCKSRCSDGFLSFLFHKKEQSKLLVALNKKQLYACHLYDENKFFDDNKKVDEIVGINFDESYLFKMALLLYGLPILLIVLFLIGGYYIFYGLNFNVDIGGMLGLIAGLATAKYLINFSNYYFKPRVKFFS